MNKIIQNAEQLFLNIRSDFSSLWKCKLRGETLEIITPFTTITGRFISVFLTQRDDRYIVTDGQRLTQHLNELAMLTRRANVYLEETASIYGVRKTQDTKACFYFKSTTNVNLLSAYIYDLVFFQSNSLNSIYSEATFFEKEREEQWFSTRVNNLLQEKIDSNKTLNCEYVLDRKHDLIHNAGFSSVLTRSSATHIWAAMCITGSNTTNFCSTIYRANTGFMYVNENSELRNQIRIAAVFDENAKGNVRDNERIKFARKVMGNCNPQIYTFEEIRNKDLMELCA